MAMSFEIVTDSSANLTKSLIDTYHIHVLPLTLRDGENEIKSFRDGCPLDPAPYYRRMAENGEFFTTSCVNPTDALELLTPLAEAGRDILYLGFSSGLSGTCQNVMSALDELRERFPERVILGCDTLCASLGQGLLTVLAARLRDRGEPIDAVLHWVMENRLRAGHWFCVDSLKYLHRGGRVSAAGAVLGTLLDIKPILHMNAEGRLESVNKVRGSRAVSKELLKCLRSADADSPVYIVHAACEARALDLAEAVRAELGEREIVIAPLDLVVGAHSGPGTLSVFFMGGER